MENKDTDSPANHRISTKKRWILFVFVPLLWLAFLVFGTVFEADKGLSRTTDAIAGIGFNILTFAWCRIDSKERGYRLHRYFVFATIVFGLLALLYYLFRSRGFRGGLISIGWFLLYTVLSTVVSGAFAIIILLTLASIGVVSPDVFSE
ncbi:MAG: hypothetical protein AB7Q37_18125 [Pyrinomonadaceae bacterium]